MKPPGRHVRIDGREVHVLLDGPDPQLSGARGGPPVVLCGGLAGNWFDWDATAAALARDRTVVRFDRPGFGLSPPTKGAPTARGEAERIVAVLDALDMSAPVVVVGHSLGGFYVEAFARLHPERTAAVVLLDASSGRGALGAVPRAWRTGAARATATALSATGLQRLLGPVMWRVVIHARPPGGTPTATAAWARRVWRDPDYLEAALVENAVYPDLAGEVDAMRRSRPRISAPVLVVAAHTGRRTPWGHASLRRQRRLAESLDGRFEVLRPAHHLAMIDQPDRLAALIRTFG